MLIEHTTLMTPLSSSFIDKFQAVGVSGKGRQPLSWGTLGFQTHHLSVIATRYGFLKPVTACYWAFGKAEHWIHGSLVTLWLDSPIFWVGQLELNDSHGETSLISQVCQVKIIYSGAQSAWPGYHSAWYEGKFHFPVCFPKSHHWFKGALNSQRFS